MRDRWLSVVGMGEGGLDGLNRRARMLLEGAETLVSGKRLFAMLPDDGRERLFWPRGAKPGLLRPAKGSSKRMPSVVGGLAKVRAHAGRTDRPIEAGRAMRVERSCGAPERAR